jgi:NAD(P)-dependent dehydrogenase (short-subunit alcohol dehydrogenase family)
MRDLAGRNRPAADELLALGRSQGLNLRVVDLDVRSQESADAAVATVIDEAGRLDVVVHNAGHLSLGYTEAYSAEEMADLLDVNALSAQRVNRAALPHLRARGTGTLVYIGSTTTVSVPPFLGPYVVSKFAFDALAQVTAYEVAPYGIETVIVMPGAFTRGTNHFAHASGPADVSVTAEYADLDHYVANYGEYVANYGEATEGLFVPGSDPDPVSVADEDDSAFFTVAGTAPTERDQRVMSPPPTSERWRLFAVARSGATDGPSAVEFADARWFLPAAHGKNRPTERETFLAAPGRTTCAARCSATSAPTRPLAVHDEAHGSFRWR